MSHIILESIYIYEQQADCMTYNKKQASKLEKQAKNEVWHNKLKKKDTKHMNHKEM